MLNFGGADSDLTIYICKKVDKDCKIDYMFFDTGLEYGATKDHLKKLEEKYGVSIIRYKAVKSIPTTCREYGQPFLSKRVSDMMQRLQKHNFQWEDEPFDVLYAKYPRCKSALQWWCDMNGSFLSIRNNKWLKEFIVRNPPTFKISSACCDYAKKRVAHTAIKDNGYRLSINGVRKAEGGTRKIMYKSCFTQKDACSEYRPIFWYSDEDRKVAEEFFGITHSDCYTKYGLIRTGCCGCPYNRDFEEELKIIEAHEPNLYKAVNHIFAESYAYTRAYRQFALQMKKAQKKGDQI